MGLTLSELDELDEGMVFDLIAEESNDAASECYHELATQEDFDKF